MKQSPLVLGLGALASGAVGVAIGLLIASRVPAPAQLQPNSPTDSEQKLDALIQMVEDIAAGPASDGSQGIVRREPQDKANVSQQDINDLLDQIREALRQTHGFAPMLNQMASLPPNVPLNGEELDRVTLLPPEKRNGEVLFLSPGAVVGKFGSPHTIDTDPPSITWTYERVVDTTMLYTFSIQFTASQATSCSYRKYMR